MCWPADHSWSGRQRGEKRLPIFFPMHLVLFSTPPHVFVFAFSLLSMLLHLMHQHLQSSQSHSWKWPPAASRSLPEFCEEHWRESFSGWQRFGILASSWQRHLNTPRLKRICCIPINICPARPFLLLQCYLVVRTALSKYYDHVLSCFSLLERLMKGNVSKNTVWMRSHDSRNRQELQKRAETFTPSSPLKGNSSSFWSPHIQ